MTEVAIEEVKRILKENLYLVIATTGTDGKPWATPLFTAQDENYHFYWISSPNSQHGQNIQANKEVSFVIFDSHEQIGKGKGVYVRGRVSELNDEAEVGVASKLLYQRMGQAIVPPASNFIGENHYRIYKVVPEKMWITSFDRAMGARTEIALSLLSGK